MDVAERNLSVGATLHLSGELVVDHPSPTAQLELSYRSERDEQRSTTRAERLVRTFFIRLIEPPGGILSERGRHRFEIELGPQRVSGLFDVALAAVDDRASTVLSERWQEILVGQANPNGWPSLPITVEWHVQAAR